MRIVDANVLIYAVNSSAPRHEPSRAWLDRALGGADTVGLAWVALTGFVRLTTRPGLFPRPLSTSDALGLVDAWVHAPSARVVQPGSAHLDSLRQLLAESGSGGNLVTDAHLAAIAHEHRADIVSYDADFSSFRSVRSYRPEDLLD